MYEPLLSEREKLWETMEREPLRSLDLSFNPNDYFAGDARMAGDPHRAPVASKSDLPCPALLATGVQPHAV